MIDTFFPSHTPFRRATSLVGVAALLFSGMQLAGCKAKPVDDATLSNNVHSALTSDASIASEPIQASALQGTVTLTGNVTNDTARIVAAQDAAKVSGVRMVVNNLSVDGQAVAPTIVSSAAPTVVRPATVVERRAIAQHQPLPPPPVASALTPTQPSAPPPPAYRDITLPAGTVIPVRITQTLDSDTAQTGTPFSGVVAGRVDVEGMVAIPGGTPVSGTVVDAKDAGHYKGNSMLSVALTTLNRRGSRISVSTEPYTVEGKGRGKNTAEKIGGGAAVGAILGGILGGGKGAAIGAGVGGGGGAVYNGVTRGQQVQISSESVIRFRLANPVTVRSYDRTSPDDEPAYGLQERNP